MAETTAPKPWSFDAKTFEAKVAKLDAAVQAVAGKPGYNPYLWWNNNVAPAVLSVKNGKPDEALVKKVLALPDVVPPIKP